MTHHSRGFALLLSVLVISMILSVALGITDIVLKENQLSALVRESEAAFHAADKGIDCALFYHISYDRNSPQLLWSPFPTSTNTGGSPSQKYYPPPDADTASCDGDQLDMLPSWVVTNTNATEAKTSFHLDFGTPPNAPCVDVSVYNKNGGATTTITAEGYNTCNTASPIRTLRVIEVTTSI